MTEPAAAVAFGYTFTYRFVDKSMPFTIALYELTALYY